MNGDLDEFYLLLLLLTHLKILVLLFRLFQLLFQHSHRELDVFRGRLFAN